MSRYRRSQAPGATFFFTVNSYRRQPILTEPAVRTALREALIEVQQEQPFVIHAWSLLPNHLHCIWELPEGDADFGKRWGRIKAKVSKTCRSTLDTLPVPAFSHRKRHEATLWQRRFWEHQIRNERDFERHVDYIHWNPVKHGLVERVQDWPYSTFHRFVRDGVYSADWAGNLGAEDAEASYGE